MIEIITFNKDIKEGQLFIAKKSTVEGRDKVTLVPVEDPERFEEELEYRIKMEGHLS